MEATQAIDIYKEHITNGTPCWCDPEVIEIIEHSDGATSRVWAHRELH